MGTIHLTEKNLKRIFLDSYNKPNIPIKEVDIIYFKSLNLLYGKLKNSYGNEITKQIIYDWLFKEHIQHRSLYLEYIDSIKFVRTIDHKITAELITTYKVLNQEDIETCVSKLKRQENGYAVLVFYNNITFIKENLTLLNAKNLEVELKESKIETAQLIYNYGFRKFR